MANVKKIDDETLMLRLAEVFKNYGYEGASLSLMSQATGLHKPSFYHRFPGGKAQMAEEVLNFANAWLEGEVFSMLRGVATPEKKMERFVRAMDQLYEGGNASCVLNMLAPPRGETESFSTLIAASFKQLLKALARLAQEKSVPKSQAEINAEQVIVELQGALVFTRGNANTAAFKRMLQRLPGILFSTAA